MQNVLVPVDFSPVSTRVIDTAGQVARVFSATLWLLHVAPRDPDLFGQQLRRKVIEDDDVPDTLAEVHGRLKSEAARLGNAVVDARTILIRGNAARTIIDEAARLPADLIVMGSHGRSAVYRALVGSVSEQVMTRAECPLLILPARVLEAGKPKG